jgi:integrase
MTLDKNLLQRVALVQNNTTELLKGHRRKVAEKTVLPSSTAEQREIALRGYSDEELFARAKRASPATIERMRIRAVAVLAEAQAAFVSVWKLVEERSGNYNSWYTFKAAVQRYLEDEIAVTKCQLHLWPDKVLENFSSDDLKGGVGRLLVRLEALSVALQQVPSGAPERFKSDGKAKRYATKSKSFSIRTADDDWRERVASSMVGDLKLFFLLQCVTGCRPQELANGVQIRLLRDGTMVARVKGAKCDEFVGQPSRCLRLTTADGVTLMLASLLKMGHTLDSRKFTLGPVNTYATRVARACAKAFPDRKGRKRLSPYSVRHQFKADLVDAGWSRVAVAMAMGHSTTRSGTAYGQGGRGGGSGVKPVAIKAVRSVKLRGEYPQARSGPAAAAANAQSGQRPRKTPRM